MAKAPPPVQKKGIGCCGCGCILLALVAALLLGLVIGATYFGSVGALKLTLDKPPKIPTFDGGDDVYNGAMQKLKDFDHDVHDHQAATIRLSASEINTMIARNPSFAGNKIRLYVALTNDQAQVQTSAPTDAWFKGYFLKDRYVYSEMEFGLIFDSSARTVNLALKRLLVGQVETPKENLSTLESVLNPAINQTLQKDPEAKKIIDQASSIEIKNGEVVIETK